MDVKRSEAEKLPYPARIQTQNPLHSKNVLYQLAISLDQFETTIIIHLSTFMRRTQ